MEHERKVNNASNHQEVLGRATAAVDGLGIIDWGVGGGYLYRFVTFIRRCFRSQRSVSGTELPDI